jgi:hypothetical protein
MKTPIVSVVKKLIPQGVILELGCGEHSSLVGCELSHRTIGLDIYRPYIEKHLANKDYLNCHEIDITSEKVLPFLKTYPGVVLIDILEHLNIIDGEILLDRLDRYSKCVLILTPNGYINNTPDDDNEYQMHLSGWTVKDFKKHGYKVRGYNGLKCLRGEKAVPVIPGKIGAAIAILSQAIAWFKPNWAFHILAIKTPKG